MLRCPCSSTCCRWTALAVSSIKMPLKSTPATRRADPPHRFLPKPDSPLYKSITNSQIAHTAHSIGWAATENNAAGGSAAPPRLTHAGMLQVSWPYRGERRARLLSAI